MILNHSTTAPPINQPSVNFPHPFSLCSTISALRLLHSGDFLGIFTTAGWTQPENIRIPASVHRRLNSPHPIRQADVFLSAAAGQEIHKLSTAVSKDFHSPPQKFHSHFTGITQTFQQAAAARPSNPPKYVLFFQVFPAFFSAFVPLPRFPAAAPLFFSDL